MVWRRRKNLKDLILKIWNSSQTTNVEDLGIVAIASAYRTEDF
jgi:hypothetical protein